MFCEIGVLKYFAEFTRNNHKVPFFSKVTGIGLQISFVFRSYKMRILATNGRSQSESLAADFLNFVKFHRIPLHVARRDFCEFLHAKVFVLVFARH